MCDFFMIVDHGIQSTCYVTLDKKEVMELTVQIKSEDVTKEHND